MILGRGFPERLRAQGLNSVFGTIGGDLLCDSGMTDE